MGNLKEKKGISLIVLVITIIVMIILAAAIILSISNSGIMDKANKAKQDSDVANLKEYVNVLEAEWELGTKETSKEVYVNTKLEEKGYTGALFMEDGTLYTNLQSNAKAALKAGIEIGDVVTGYTLDTSKSSYTTTGEENTARYNSVTYEETAPTPQTVNQTEFTTWRYIGVSDNGELEIAPDMISNSNEIQLAGKGGYLNGPEVLNKVCKALYSTDKGTARSMNIDDVVNILGYTGPKGGYFMNDYEYVSTLAPMTVEELENKLGKQLTNRLTINDEKFENYLSNLYTINKFDNVNDMKFADRVDLIFFEDVYCYYFLASNCATVSFGMNPGMFTSSSIEFGIRTVCNRPDSEYWSTNVASLYSSSSKVGANDMALRPVVQLKSNVSVTYDSATNTLTLN